MGANGTPNKVRSSKMAWLRKRISTMEPEQVAHTARPYLQGSTADLDSITAAWLPFVSEPVGPNDAYHDEYWSSLSWDKEKLVVSAGFDLFKLQLHGAFGEKTADLLLQAGFGALSGYNCKVQLVLRLMQPSQKSDLGPLRSLFWALGFFWAFSIFWAFGGLLGLF